MAKSRIFLNLFFRCDTWWHKQHQLGGGVSVVLYRGRAWNLPPRSHHPSWTKLCFVPLPKGKEINSVLDQVSPVIFPGTLQPVFWD